MKIFFLFFVLVTSMFAMQISDTKLKQMIGQMLIVGFPNTSVNKQSKIIKDINKYKLGGVILFDVFYTDRERNKNISSSTQLKKLSSDLQRLTQGKIIISVDQEGGHVARLKPKYGFKAFPSAKKVSSASTIEAKRSYKEMSIMLQENGINCNFAPVVDLEINPKNKVIVGLERSFSKSSMQVKNYASILIDEQEKVGIISVLKHFPGHGSSLGDSHLGFVDITDTWSEKELEPYQYLIDSGKIKMIMTAHVFNKHLDDTYPATLSYNVNTKLLRQKMDYKGVVVSDDLQMRAISKHYSLQETVTLAINAGVDILLFGNQLAAQGTDEIVQSIFTQVKNGKIPLQRIIQSNKRIKKLHE
ncbi:MAG: glycoside hydrolase family 3 N-terminal domain-containing protein [Sulfurimonas sp.]|nr:glycoside hydrolase family 3 N-terminal domain-containing protein [Sulfurimonas sp.]MDQ7060072.1 glycoside hydrolase family 3 N-terminal domain-containing protein [Sulfurimonas sp.]